MGINFGDLDEKTDTTPEIAKPSKPLVDWERKYESEKKLREDVEAISAEKGEKLMETSKKYEKLQSAFALSNESNEELREDSEQLREQLESSWAANAAMETDLLADRENFKDLTKKAKSIIKERGDTIGMLRQQEAMSKQAIDRLTLEVERYKFRPHQYSEIAQILVSMRVRGNPAQKAAVERIVGTTDITAVRKYIFDLLEAPYQ